MITPYHGEKLSRYILDDTIWQPYTLGLCFCRLFRADFFVSVIIHKAVPVTSSHLSYLIALYITLYLTCKSPWIKPSVRLLKFKCEEEMSWVLQDCECTSSWHFKAWIIPTSCCKLVARATHTLSTRHPAVSGNDATFYISERCRKKLLSELHLNVTTDENNKRQQTTLNICFNHIQ